MPVSTGQKLVGCKYFIQLDDDYHEFQFQGGSQL